MIKGVHEKVHIVCYQMKSCILLSVIFLVIIKDIAHIICVRTQKRKYQ